MLIFIQVHDKCSKKYDDIKRVKEICNSKYIDIQEVHTFTE